MINNYLSIQIAYEEHYIFVLFHIVDVIIILDMLCLIEFKVTQFFWNFIIFKSLASTAQLKLFSRLVARIIMI